MRFPLPALLLAATVACGGGGSSPEPPPSQNPPNTTPANPCAASETAPDERVSRSTAPLGRQKPSRDGDESTRWRVLEDLWIHRQAQQARSTAQQADASAPVSGIDIGDIAVVQDEGDLLVPPNPLDLRGTGLRFTPNGSGGYDARVADASFRTSLGTRLTLEDDDTQRVDVPFAFPFYGQSRTAAFVNSDGNVTFEEGDSASTERNVARLLTGPPRVAVFLADLDPSTAGSVFVHAAADQYTVTWCGVREFDSPRVTSVQATLLPDGTVDMKFGGTISVQEAVIGISPGTTTEFAAVDLSTGGAGPALAALAERFAAVTQLDTVAVARKFYRSHADGYDQLAVWTDVAVVRGAFAYETTVANDIRGLGIDVYDLAAGFGSGGRLESLAIMDTLAKYPGDPAQRVLNEGSTLAVLAHEVAHRWLAFFDLRNHRGEITGDLLGRDMAHWSFFLDSDASVMEGNDIDDLAGGSFRTVGAMRGFSRLDLYAMGLVRESDVPPFFYVESPVNVTPPRERESPPTSGVTFSGTRRDVLIQDVVAANGPRSPSAADAPRQHTLAFIYVVGAGRTAAADQVDKLDRIRRAFEPFFRDATGGRMTVETELR